MEINSLHCGDAVSFLKDLEDGVVHLHLFSPPYDEIREYDGRYSFEYEKIAPEMYRTLCDGGIAVMIIQDKITDGAQSGSSIRAGAAFLDSDFQLFSHSIYSRHGVPGRWWNKTLRVDHENIFIFFKGNSPRVFNKEALKVPALHAGKRWNKSTRRGRDGTLQEMGERTQEKIKCRGTLWHYNTNYRTQDPIKKRHPATFPDQLALDVITGFSHPGDLVVDAYVGNGTTAWAAAKLGRNYIGNDISETYLKDAQERINGLTCITN